MDKVVEDVQDFSSANLLWNNIVEQCNVKLTKGCFKNIVKLYVIMRGFSFARDTVNKYKRSKKNTVEGFMETVKG